MFGNNEFFGGNLILDDDVLPGVLTRGDFTTRDTTPGDVIVAADGLGDVTLGDATLGDFTQGDFTTGDRFLGVSSLGDFPTGDVGSGGGNFCFLFLVVTGISSSLELFLPFVCKC